MENRRTGAILSSTQICHDHFWSGLEMTCYGESFLLSPLWRKQHTLAYIFVTNSLLRFFFVALRKRNWSQQGDGFLYFHMVISAVSRPWHEGGRSSRHLDKEGGGGGGGWGRQSPKKFLSALRASVWSKRCWSKYNELGGWAPGPLTWIRHWK